MYIDAPMLLPQSVGAYGTCMFLNFVFSKIFPLNTEFIKKPPPNVTLVSLVVFCK